MKRVSDRLPIPARRSRGGKHVAPRTAATPVVPSATPAPTGATDPAPTGATRSTTDRSRRAAHSAATPVVTLSHASSTASATAPAPTAAVPTDTVATRAVLHRGTQHRLHLLPRGGGLGARLAQGAVVAVLALALGGTVTAAASARAEQTQAAATAAEAAATARADVADAVGIADDVIEVSTAAQTEGEQAAVDVTRLAALETATAHLEALVDALDDPAEARDSAAASRSVTRDDADPSSVDAGTSVDAPAAGGTSGTPATGTDPATGTTAGTATPAPDAAAPTATPTAPAVTAADATPTTVRSAAAEVSALAEEVRTSAEANRTAAAAAAAQAEADAAAAAEAARVAAEQAAQRAAWKASLLGYANGKIPASALCGVSFDASVQLRCDAAESLEQLNTAYVAAFGTNMTISDSYRSYAGQVACRRTKGWLCAAPGTSNHGTGVAIDFGGGIESFGTKQFAWMKANAGQFSWEHPSWAERGGSKPEAWHWEYVG